MAGGDWSDGENDAIVADYFGPRRFATIRGLMNPISTLGGVLGQRARARDQVRRY